MKDPDLAPMSPEGEWQTVLSISFVPRSLCVFPELNLKTTLLFSRQFYLSDTDTTRDLVASQVTHREDAFPVMSVSTLNPVL